MGKRKRKRNKSQASAKLTAKELEGFKKLLLAKRAFITGDLDRLHNETLSKSRQEAAGDISNMPTHMPDIASDNFEQEFSVGLIENVEDEVREIDAALERIEEGSFGICESCNQSVPKARLRAIPYARLCVECKRKEELGQ
jgi:RNA polymerase-binding transcription factor DksA